MIGSPWRMSLKRETSALVSVSRLKFSPLTCAAGKLAFIAWCPPSQDPTVLFCSPTLTVTSCCLQVLQRCIWMTNLLPRKPTPLIAPCFTRFPTVLASPQPYRSALTPCPHRHLLQIFQKIHLLSRKHERHASHEDALQAQGVGDIRRHYLCTRGEGGCMVNIPAKIHDSRDSLNGMPCICRE